MKFRFSLGAIAALALLPFLAIASDAAGQVPKNISMTVGVCDPVYGQRCIKPDTNGAVPVTGSLTPSGTQDVNTKQVNGAAVNVGVGAAGTGTQRVTTSTDSTIGTVTAVTAITNALPAGANLLGKVGIDQTTPGTTNGVQTLSGSTTAVTQATASNLNAQVQGNVASAAADSGNPVKIGGIYNTTRPTFTNGQRGDGQLDARGNFATTLCDTGGVTCTSVQNGGADGVSNGNQGVLGYNRLVLFNGSTWDRGFTCSNSAAVNVTAGATTQIVGLSGSTVIRVCSLAISMSAAGSAGVYTGTGSNCGTGTTALIQDMTLATGTPVAMSAPVGGAIVRSSAGGEICVKAVTGNVTGVITYAQF